jgi:hypothetical protein
LKLFFFLDYFSSLEFILFRTGMAPKETQTDDGNSSQSPRDVVIEQPQMLVTVSCANKIFSITSCPFDFFFPTDASRCIIFGPALLDGVVGGEEACFAIQTRDSMGNVRSVGGDEFQVLGRRVNTIAEQNEKDTKIAFQKAKQDEAAAIADGTDASAIENTKEAVKKTKFKYDKAVKALEMSLTEEGSVLEVVHVDRLDGTHVFTLQVPTDDRR